MVKNVKCGVTAGLLLIVLSGTSMQGDEPLLEFKVPGQIRDFTISPDNKLVAINDSNLGDGDEALSIWSIVTGKRVIGLNNVGADRHTEDIRGVAFSPDGHRLAANFQNAREVRVWETKTWRILHHLRVDKMGRGSCLAFSADSKTLASGNPISGDDSTPPQSPLLWNVETGRLFKTLTTKLRLLPRALDFSPDNKYLACRAGNCLCVWQRGTADDEMREILPLRGKVLDAEFSQNGKQLVIATLHDVHILETGTWKESRRIVPGGMIRQVQCIPKSDLVAVVTSADGMPILDFYDGVSGKKTRRVIDFDARYGPAKARRMYVRIACSPDGKKVVVSNLANQLSVWNVEESR